MNWVGTALLGTAVALLGQLPASAAITTLTLRGVTTVDFNDWSWKAAPSFGGGALPGVPFESVLTIDDAAGFSMSSDPNDHSTLENAAVTMQFTLNGRSVSCVGTFRVDTRSSPWFDVFCPDSLLSLRFSKGTGMESAVWSAPRTVLFKPGEAIANFDFSIVNDNGYQNTAGGLILREIAIGNEAGASTVASPLPGMWWNPAESGRGWMLDPRSATMVVTTYSYNPDGSAQWYLSVGSLTKGVVSANMETYAGGQCLTCLYKAPQEGPVPGKMTMQFTTPTTGTMTLPDGRTLPIQWFWH